MAGFLLIFLVAIGVPGIINLGSVGDRADAMYGGSVVSLVQLGAVANDIRDEQGLLGGALIPGTVAAAQVAIDQQIATLDADIAATSPTRSPR